MGSAEQGGNHPQRVLFIGGPKHGEFMNLPLGQLEYGFTSMKTLMPSTGSSWGAWPENATHNYKYDPDLTRSIKLSGQLPSAANLFTHEVLWGSPQHGGFNLLALSDALRTLEEAKTKAESLLDAQKTTSNTIRRLENECKDWQEKYEKLLDLNAGMDDQLCAVRILLEGAAADVLGAIDQTGREYESPFNEA